MPLLRGEGGICFDFGRGVGGWRGSDRGRKNNRLFRAAFVKLDLPFNMLAYEFVFVEFVGSMFRTFLQHFSA